MKLGILAILLGFVLAPQSASAGLDDVRLALLPVVVHSSESPEYLRAGLSDMLSARFEQLEQVEVIRVEDSHLATSRLEQAVEAGRSAGADFVLFGSFTRFGQGASLDVQCAATHAEPDAPLRKIFVHSGSIGDVIPDLDDLVGKVTRFLIDDFESSRASKPAGAPRPRGEQIDDLLRRVEALERSVGRLESPNAAAAESGPRAEAALR